MTTETTVTTETTSKAAREAFERLEELYRKYAVLPSEHHYTALVLWAAHTWVVDAFDTTPRLFLDSPVPACGKTRVLELLEGTAKNPLSVFNASSAALIRTIDKGDRAILFDEIDSIYAKATGTEDITAVVNAGYKRGATVPRCVGQGMDIEVVELRAFAPIALAGLYTQVPDAVRSRSVHFRMAKRRPTEHISPFKKRVYEKETQSVRDFFLAWAEPAVELLDGEYPELPAGIEDRDAEVWEPLVAVADLVGGAWPKRAREAAEAFVFGRRPDAPTLGVEMLELVREIVGDKSHIRTGTLLSAIVVNSNSPWSETQRGPLTARSLATVLRPFEVFSRQFRDPKSGDKARGYCITGEGGLGEAFERYLDPLETPAT